MSRFAPPPVQMLEPSPTSMAGAQGVAANLNASADRAAAAALQKAKIAAEAKMQQEALDAQQKLAEQQAEATASEHAKYQQFLAGQQQTEIAAQSQQRDKDRALQESFEQHRREREDRLLQLRQDALKRRDNMRAEMFRRAAGQSAVDSDEMGGVNKTIDSLEDELAAIQYDRLPKAEASKQMVSDSLYSTADNISKARVKVFTDSADLTKGAVDAAFRSVESPTFWKMVGDNIKSGHGGPITTAMDILDDRVTNWFGGKVEYAKNASNDIYMLAQGTAEKLAPRLVAMAKDKGVGPGALKDRLAAFLAAGAWASASMGAKGGDISDVSLKHLENTINDLRQILPPEAIEGVARQMDDLPAAYTKLDEKDSKLFTSELKARQKMLDSFGGFSAVFKYATQRDGSRSPITPADRDLVNPIRLLVAGHALTSFNHSEFLQRLTDMGLSPEHANRLLSVYDRFGEGEVPQALRDRRRDLERQLKGQERKAGQIKQRSESMRLMDMADILEGGAGSGIADDLMIPSLEQ